MLSFGLAFLNILVPGKREVNFYICTGEDPKNFDHLGKKVMSKDRQIMKSFDLKIL